MVKKALCVGCNYPSKAFGLAGSVNDAFLLAECLQQHCGFNEENISVLHDVYPGQKKSMKVDPSRAPTRVNILHHLQYLVRSARPGDVLFFSFSGYGLQVDDMDGYQDEGYDEAILPTDFVDGRDGDYTVIVADDIHDILMGIPPNCSVTVLMDCDHATSIIDVSGTLEGKLVNGLKYNNFCGLKGHTVKMQLASHNRDVWQEEKAKTVKARPRFQPMMEIDNPRKGRLPTRPSMSRSTPVAFCFSAAGHEQTALEMQMTAFADGKETQKQQGLLSWSFVKALEELRYDCTYMELLMGIRRQFHAIKVRDLPRMDQEVLLTYSTPLSDPSAMRILMPLNGQQGQQAGRGISGPMPFAVPAVVPPPAPGVVISQGAAAPGAAAAPAGFAVNPAGAGTGGTGAAVHDTESGDAWPPLPPPPPPLPSAARRCSSELVHHTVKPGEGGSFSVQGGTGAPLPARGNREPWREPSFEAGSHTTGGPGESQRLPPSASMVLQETSQPTGQAGIGYPPPRPQQGSGQELAREPPQDAKLAGTGFEHTGATNPSEFGLFGFFAGGSQPRPAGMPQAPGGLWPQSQPGMPLAPASGKVPALTPPNLFAGGSAPLGISHSFGQSFSQMHGGAAMAGMHGPPAVPPQRWR